MPPSPHGRSDDAVARDVAPARNHSPPAWTYAGPPLSPLQLSRSRNGAPATNSVGFSAPYRGWSRAMGPAPRRRRPRAPAAAGHAVVPAPARPHDGAGGDLVRRRDRARGDRGGAGEHQD